MENTLPQTVEQVTAVMMNDNISLVDAAKGAVIESEENLSTAVDILSTIKERIKKIENERTTIVKPINDSVNHINSRFKALTEPLKDAQAGLTRKVMTFQSEVEAKKRAEAEKERQRREAELLASAQKKEELGNTEEAEKLLGYATKVKAVVEETGRGGFTGAKSIITKTWDYEVTDMGRLANEMPALVQENSGAIRAKIRDGIRDIPGLRIFQKENISIRG